MICRGCMGGLGTRVAAMMRLQPEYDSPHLGTPICIVPPFPSFSSPYQSGVFTWRWLEPLKLPDGGDVDLQIERLAAGQRAEGDGGHNGIGGAAIFSLFLFLDFFGHFSRNAQLFAGPRAPCALLLYMAPMLMGCWFALAIRSDGTPGSRGPGLYGRLVGGGAKPPMDENAVVLVTSAVRILNLGLILFARSTSPTHAPCARRALLSALACRGVVVVVLFPPCGGACSLRVGVVLLLLLYCFPPCGCACSPWC